MTRAFPVFPRTADCVVAGGGVIGLSAARILAASGLRVMLFDRGAPGQEASRAAAGMLCPRLESASASPLLAAGLESLGLYPAFVAALEEESGRSLDLRLNGALCPLDSDQAEPEEAFPGAVIVAGQALRALEPALAPRIERAIFVPGEGSIDNRALTAALLDACVRRGVEVVPGSRVLEVLTQESRVVGVLADTGAVASPFVVNTLGAWAGLLGGSVPAVGVRPIKGQMLLVERRVGPGDCDLEHTVHARDVYIVPRTNGRTIIGTTVEDRGFDKSVDPWVVQSLLEQARGHVPLLAGLEPRERWAGLRPWAPAELPDVGARGPDGYFVAVGHFRNGILLTPWTEARIARAVLGGGSSAASIR